VWALTALTVTPNNTRATRFELRFGGSDVEAYTCQVDAQPQVDCVSPFTLSMLAPGEHTVVVTPVGTTLLCIRLSMGWPCVLSPHPLTSWY
jgi:hypothetical protein